MFIYLTHEEYNTGGTGYVATVALESEGASYNAVASCNENVGLDAFLDLASATLSLSAAGR